MIPDMTIEAEEAQTEGSRPVIVVWFHRLVQVLTVTRWFQARVWMMSS